MEVKTILKMKKHNYITVLTVTHHESGEGNSN